MDTVCLNCGIPIRWQPTVIDGKVYCCLGCAAGGPCECDYDHLPMPSDRVSIVLRHTQTLEATQTSRVFTTSFQLIIKEE
jgi:hypothetical protein